MKVTFNGTTREYETFITHAQGYFETIETSIVDELTSKEPQIELIVNDDKLKDISAKCQKKSIFDTNNKKLLAMRVVRLLKDFTGLEIEFIVACFTSPHFTSKQVASSLKFSPSNTHKIIYSIYQKSPELAGIMEENWRIAGDDTISYAEEYFMPESQYLPNDILTACLAVINNANKLTLNQRKVLRLILENPWKPVSRLAREVHCSIQLVYRTEAKIYDIVPCLEDIVLHARQSAKRRDRLDKNISNF